MTINIQEKLESVSEKAQEMYYIITARSKYYISEEDYDFFIYFSLGVLTSYSNESIKSFFNEYVQLLNELNKVGLIGEWYYKKHCAMLYTVYVTDVVI